MCHTRPMVESVRLLGVPPVLFMAWEQYIDSLLREYVLADVAGLPYGMGDVAKARQAQRVVASAVYAADTQSMDADRLIDVEVALPSTVAPQDFSLLQAILDHGNALSRAGEFLTMPVLPELGALRNWLCEEAVSQAAGGAPTRWTFDRTLLLDDTPIAQWPGLAELPSDGSWLVGDDHNRIIEASRPALELLEWPREELVGQRIISVIPPALRNAHVAAFANATVTGEHRLLDRPLQLDAWTHGGRTVPITLTLHHHSAAAGRSVYVGWLTPR